MPSQGKLVHSTAAHRGCRFRTKKESAWQFADVAVVFVYAIVESGYVHHLCETGGKSIFRPVHALRNGACRVKPVAKVLQMLGYHSPLVAPLLWYLVANAPHHYRRVIAVRLHKSRNITVAPFLKESGIAVFAFWINPHVEALGHNHHAKRIAHVHLDLRWMVVRRANGIASHVLKLLDLPYDSRFIDRCAKRPKIMMQTNALYLATHAIELEAMY